MGNCGNKIKQTCSSPTFAICTKYEGDVSENTTLNQISCLSVQEVIEDLYDLHDILKAEVDVTAIEDGCITFTEPKTASSVILQLYTKLCELEAIITTQQTTIETMQQDILDLEENACP